MDSVIPQFTVVLLVGFVASVFCRLCGFPSLPGYVVAGVLIGPSGLHLIRPGSEIESLAEIGVVFLLFAIGIELSFEELRRLWKQCLISGTLQVGTCCAVVALLCRIFGMSWSEAFVIGLIVAVGSTIIVFRALTEWGYMGHPAGQRAIGVNLFQDAAVLPVMIWIATRSVDGPPFGSVLLPLLVAGLVLLALPIIRLFIARWVIPRLGRLRSTEIAVIFGLLILSLFGYLSHLMRLPVALGALAAGLVLNGNRMTKQLDALVLPFRETFGAVFFISLGAYLDVIERSALSLGILVLCGLFLVVKAISLVISLRLSGLPWKPALGLSAALLQLGELSLLLLWQSRQSHVISTNMYNGLILTALATLVTTPALVHWGFQLLRSSLRRRQDSRDVPTRENDLRKVVLIGAGPMGSHIAAYLETLGMDVCLVDQSPLNLQPFAQQGFRTICGDGRDPETLRRAGIMDAWLVVVCVPDDNIATMIVKGARQLNQNATIVARCRYQSHRAELQRAGANTIIVEEIEAAWAVRRCLESNS